MTTIDLSQGPVTLSFTPVPGPAGPAGMGASVPGGRLTLVSGQPEMPPTADYASTTLYYAPFESDQIPLFDGAVWGGHPFAAGPLDSVGLSLSGGAKWAADTRRDVFVTLIGGAPTLCTGPAWPGDTVEARWLLRRNGLWVNAADMTGDLSATAAAVIPAHRATWVGSINIGATAGTLSATFTLGQNRRCDVWNAYHQREILLGVGCPPVSPAVIVSWKPANQYPSWQAFNNDLNNSGYYFTGLPQEVNCQYIQRGFVDSLNSGFCAIMALVCKDSLDNARGTFGSYSSDTTTDATGVTVSAVFKDRGSVGSHRAIMAAANANDTGPLGVTLWGLVNVVGRAPEDPHVMWISYQG